MQRDKNVVILKGFASTEPKVEFDNENNRVKSFIVKCKRYSGFDDEVVVHLPYTYESQINPGDPIEINGQFRSYNKNINGTRRLVLFVKPDFIGKLDFLIEGENFIKLQGTICRCPVYRKTPLTDRVITDFMLAVNRPDGGTDYVPCIAWAHNALALKNAKVGERISILGRIQSREYKKVYEDGKEEMRTAYEISCGSLRFEQDLKANPDKYDKKDYIKDEKDKIK